MRELLDIDINGIATKSVEILQAYLNGYKGSEKQVNELYKLIKSEFSKDASIGLFDRAYNFPEETDNWKLTSVKLAERMRTNPVLSNSVKILVDKIRPDAVEPKKLSSKMTMLAILISLAGILLSGWMSPQDIGDSNLTPMVNYILVFIFMIVLLIAISMNVIGRADGVLIDTRNRMCLSRFQIVLWTVILLSAYFSIALLRIRAEVPNALGITIDESLWALMGISIASLVGAPLILYRKKDKIPSQKSLKAASIALKEPADIITTNSIGLLYASPNSADASFTDIFKGDEIANANLVDVSKVQMFLFTLIAAFSYLIQILKMMNDTTNPSSLNALPELSQGLVAILLISHAGYLTNKSINRTEIAID